MKTIKTISCLLLILAFCFAGFDAHGADFLPEGEFVFFWENRLAYLIANKAALNSILHEMSEVTEVPIITDPADKTSITADLREKSLEDLIKSICPSSVITFEKGEHPGEYRVASVKATATTNASKTKQKARERVVRENKLDSRMRPRHRKPIEYVGIGAHVSPTKDRKGLWLKPINKESPAYKGGIRKGDMVLEIDGKPIPEFRHLGYAIRAIRGKPKTSVQFRIREPDGSDVYKTIVREKFRYDPRKNRENQNGN